MAKELAEVLDVELDLTSIIPYDLRSESVRKPLKHMTDVIEETLNFIAARMKRKSLGELRDYYSDVCFF